MPTEKIESYKHTCIRKGCIWYSRVEHPRVCGVCKNPGWDTPITAKRYPEVYDAIRALDVGESTHGFMGINNPLDTIVRKFNTQSGWQEYILSWGGEGGKVYRREKPTPKEIARRDTRAQRTDDLLEGRVAIPEGMTAVEYVNGATEEENSEPKSIDTV